MDLKTSPFIGHKLSGADKLAAIPVKMTSGQKHSKPEWIRSRINHPEEIQYIQQLLRQQKLHRVCEEATCTNLPQCFGQGTATFMIMGNICTRRCLFCNVTHGQPKPLDPQEPEHLAETVKNLNLSYVVITSVDRDDLADGGAQHFAHCITAIRQSSPNTLIEILVPDFRGRLELALNILRHTPPDVFNHNIETVPRLYRALRPGSDYQHALQLLHKFKSDCPEIATKCGLMVGLGEIEAEVLALLNDLKDHQIDYVTIGQYVQPSVSHTPIQRVVSLKEFEHYQSHGKLLGFKNIWSAPMVRSSYFAQRQYQGEPVPQPFKRDHVKRSIDLNQSI
ncbi:MULTISPECIES: lipoyl synthase [unclassified Acinetobacter]|uniref:lipoyl synthase n=1 Tax=unclassified Acinetobacter TaxID=196816 RepID=UPI0029344C2D|nr:MULTISPECIES: lipoyl synthase [unclassified Acinetobacter]WOE31527.1 lipoyl synthase [Acinetobacter sp. SAAs470]WOE39723.1 lipoyl synthase [Acinetobacter sp. SAAs474]